MEVTLPLKLLLAMVLGGLIGLERESATDLEARKESGDKWGLRTYSLISLLGAIAGLLSLYGNLYLSVIITISFFILIFIYYGLGGWMIKSMGLTTELGGIFSFLVGYFVTSEIFPVQLVIAITIVIQLILSVKEKSHNLILGIKRTEIDAFISFAIIALVILPFLPNQAYHLTDIPSIRAILEAYDANVYFFEQLELINPFRLWFIVAIITGINVFGHILDKVTGEQKGLILTSSVGGFISSTSTTISLAQKSKKLSNTNRLVAAAIFANLTSFFQVLVLVASLNSGWLVFITPVLLTIIVSSLLVGLYFYFIDHRKMKVVSEIHDSTGVGGQPSENIEIEDDAEIFSLKPAIKFALLLVLIRAFTKSALVFFGQSGFLITSTMASLTGIDAVVINLADLADKSITPQAALFALLFVNATNLLSKSAYAFFQAKKEFFFKFLVSVLFIIVASFVGYYFFS